MNSPKIIVVGAGIGGLACAIRLAQAGCAVTVIEREQHAGGKIRSANRADVELDVGPTVMTMPWVFDPLFRAAGQDMQTELKMSELQTLAHHRWRDGARLNLYADEAASGAACANLAGARAELEFQRFARRAQRIYELLEPNFMTRQQAGLTGLLGRCTPRQLLQLSQISPFRSLWNALGSSFYDARLQQLFARYATYCGSSPFLAPATLMLIAHVERLGVWRIKGGMRALAAALVRSAELLGVKFEYDGTVEQVVVTGGRASGVATRQHGRMAADAVVANTDTNAIASGLFGADVQNAVTATQPLQRSLSAVTFAGKARIQTRGLHYHNVFFSGDYRREFAALSTNGKVPAEPTVYMCAPDFGAAGEQRLFVLINAPANGDSYGYNEATIARIRRAAESQLRACGVSLDLADFEVTTPNDFDARYPGTGGALYGPAMHGWQAAFRRSGNRTRIPGLFVAGGSVHPGSGVPMAALSGQLCANEILSTGRQQSEHLLSIPAKLQKNAVR